MNLGKIYVLKNNVQRGEKINSNDVFLVETDITNINFKCVDNVDNIVAKDSLGVGQILHEENVINESEYTTMSQENKERIAIKLSDLNTNMSCIFDKGSIINIYYTGRSSQLENIINNLKTPIIKSSSISDSYTTIALMENVKVLNLYDKNGEKIENNIRQTISVDPIEIEVEQNMAVIIENLKNYGKFSVTVKR